VANRARVDWEHSIKALQGQLVIVTRFMGPTGREAFEVSGSLAAVKESIGFGVYSASDAMIRFTSSISLPDGCVQIEAAGIVSIWRAYRNGRHAWVSKEIGRMDYADGEYVQLVRSIDGHITLRI
jgi:hypothetical protein